MRWFSLFTFYVKSLFSKRKLDEQLSEEIRTHVQMATEANVAAGMTPVEARYAALREFGNVGNIQERAREGRGWVWLEQLGQDLRYAIRGLIKSPAFTLITLFTLAVGIGANTALFSVVNALLLRPLPVQAPAELVLVTANGPTDIGKAFPYPLFNKGGWNWAFPYSFYEHFSRNTRTLAGTVAFGGWPAFRQMGLPESGNTDSDRVSTVEVSGSYFPILGGPAAAGRLLNEEDDRPGHANPVVVFSHDFWSRRFGADPSVVGRTITLDGVSLKVVGVTGSGFAGFMIGSRTDLWLPLQLSPEIDQNQPWAGALKPNGLPFLCIAGRLAPGRTIAQAEAELDALFQGKLAQLDPRRAGVDQSSLLQQKIGLTPAGTGFGGLRSAYERPVTFLMAMVGLLLLVACANVAGLLLARGSARTREFAMRSALGASRRRLAAQLITESLLLASAGSVLGIGVAWTGTRWLGGYLGYLDLGPDRQVVLFITLVTVAAGLIFGLFPAWHLSRIDLVTAAKKEGKASLRLNHALVVIQIGLAFVLGIAAILLIRTFQRLSQVDTGFQSAGLYQASLTFDRQTKPEQRLELSRQLLVELEHSPGIEHATVYQGISFLSPVGIENEFKVSDALPAPKAVASIVAAGPGFFRTMGIALIRGDDFTAQPKRSDGIQPLVISEWSSKKLFGEDNPIGRRIKIGKEYEITGIARDIKYANLREDVRHVFYVPLHSRPSMLQGMVAIRAKAGVGVNLADLRAVLRRLDTTANLTGLSPLTASLANHTRQERFSAQLAGFFGAFVLMLACLGLFGLLSFGVSRRTRELGIRLALGASPRGVQGLILREGAGLLLIGVVLGAIGSLGVVRFASSLFFGVSPTEPVVYAAVFILLLATALGASWLPARRAGKVDPMVALRAE